jgi:hypothetical protein
MLSAVETHRGKGITGLASSKAPRPKPTQREQTLIALQSFCWLLVWLPGILRLVSGPPVDPQAARNVTVFRITLAGIGLLGVVVLQILRWLSPKAPVPPPAPPAPPAPPSVIAPVPAGAAVASVASAEAVNPWDSAPSPVPPPGVAAPPHGGPGEGRPYLAFPYQMTRRSDLRTDIWGVLLHPPLVGVLLGLPAFVGGIAFYVLMNRSGTAAGVFGLAGVFALWFAFLIIGRSVTMYKTFPTPNTQVQGTAFVTPEGYYDVLPEKTLFMAWSDVTAVRTRSGDVFLYQQSGNPSRLPGDGFADAEAGRRLYEAARALWKSRGADWAAVLPAPTAAPLNTELAFDLS